MKNIIFILIFAFSLTGYAQIDSSKIKKFEYGTNRFEKKFLIGGTFNSGWSRYLNFEGPEVFTKPSLGIYLKMEYYLNDWLGLSLGIGHQQMGTGIITPDFDKSLGNPDSTYRLRLRTNNLAFPLVIQLRTPNDIFSGGRLSLGLGIAPSYAYDTKTIFHSLEDGFHDKQNIPDGMTKLDIPLRGTLGLDFNASNACLFRLNFLIQYGFKNLYTDPTTNIVSGQNLLFGFDLDFLF